MGQATQPQKVLILAAIPHGLRLDKEMREVEECIRRSVRRDVFDVDIRTAVRPQDIRRAIAEEKPQIVHFCGHGLEDGSLLLEDDGGQNKAVSPEGLAALFALHADDVKCVLLNACHSAKSAQAISRYINYAIGMNRQIQDKSAIQFAQGFYDGLGYATSEQDVFPRAFQEGLVAIKLENLAQAGIPVIQTRVTIDAQDAQDAHNEPQTPMDIALLVKFLAPCLPFLLNLGNQAVAGAAPKLGEDVWQKAIAIWGKLQPKVEAKAATLEAARDVANDPEDEDLQTVLRVQLKKILAEEPALAAEIAQILSEKSVTGRVGNHIQQDVSGTGNQVIGKMAGNAKAIGQVQGNVNM